MMEVMRQAKPKKLSISSKKKKEGEKDGEEKVKPATSFVQSIETKEEGKVNRCCCGGIQSRISR